MALFIQVRNRDASGLIRWKLATEFEMSNPAYRWLETRRTVDYSNVINVFVSYDGALRSAVKRPLGTNLYRKKIITSDADIVNKCQRERKTFTTTIIIRAEDNHNLSCFTIRLFNPHLQIKLSYFHHRNSRCYFYVMQTNSSG